MRKRGVIGEASKKEKGEKEKRKKRKIKDLSQQHTHLD